MRDRRTRWGFVLVVVLGLASVLTTAAGRDALGGGPRADGEGSVQLHAIDARDGSPLPVRVQLVARTLLGETRFALAPHGDVTLKMRPGVYELVVSHGPEWSLFRRALTVHRGQALRIRAPLLREVDAADFTGCDLHVHTSESPDGKLSWRERASTLQAEDVQLAVLTDHNHVTKPSGATGVVSGVEVTSWAPEFGHFNAFPQKRAPRFKRTSVGALLRELRADPTTFVQINHPRLEHHIGYFSLSGFSPQQRAWPELGFDGIEVWNGYDLARPAQRDEVFADWLALLSRGKRLVATGGSDSHGTSAPYVGYPRTYVAVPRAHAHETARVVGALKQGRAFVTSGPILRAHVAGKGPGDSVRVRAQQEHVSLHVEVAAPRWMDVGTVEVWAGRTRVLSAPIERSDGVHGATTLQVPVTKAAFLVVVARGERGMAALLSRDDVLPYAFTNPIWLAHD